MKPDTQLLRTSAAEPAELTEPVKLAEMEEPAEPVKLAKREEPAEPTEPANLSELTVLSLNSVQFTETRPWTRTRTFIRSLTKERHTRLTSLCHVSHIFYSLCMCIFVFQVSFFFISLFIFHHLIHFHIICLKKNIILFLPHNFSHDSFIFRRFVLIIHLFLCTFFVKVFFLPIIIFYSELIFTYDFFFFGHDSLMFISWMMF